MIPVVYSKKKAEKLAKEFGYLKGKLYFPFGEEGRTFTIDSIETREHGTWIERNHGEGKDWDVMVKIKDQNEELEKPLEEVLKSLKIKHDIENMFND